jgi:hypothetical protein
MIGPGFLVYIAGQGKRDDSKVKAFADVLGLSLYDAKVLLGAPGPRRVASFLRQEEAEMKTLELRQAGFVATVVDKDRFSRAPKVFKALKAVEGPDGLLFTIETAPAPGEIQARVLEYPQPRGFVRLVVLGCYTQTSVHTDTASRKNKVVTSSKSDVRAPFLHLYAEDPHTLLEIHDPRFDFAWLKQIGIYGDLRWIQLAERFRDYYKAKLDVSLFKVPEEVGIITTPLNVDPLKGKGGSGLASSASSSDDAPLAMAASRVIAWTTVFGV